MPPAPLPSGMETVDEVDVLIDGIGSALIPAALLVVAFVRGQHLGAAVGFVQTPGLTVADILIQFQRLVLGQNTDGVDTGVYAIGKGKVDDAVLAAKRYCRLGSLFCQNLQSAALTAGQKHGNTAFFLEIHAVNSL